MKYVRPTRSRVVVADWKDVFEIGLPVRATGCEWITDESIKACLDVGRFEDVNLPQTKQSHHAARIASFVRMLEQGKTFNPIHVHINFRVCIFDGNHRFRALKYAGKTDRVALELTGHNAPRLLAKYGIHHNPNEVLF